MKFRDVISGIRHFAYIAGAVCLTMYQYVVAQYQHEATYEEGGWVENLQIGLLCFSAILFFYIGKHFNKYKWLSYCFSGACVLAVCREMDAFWDSVLPVVSWRIGFLFVVAAAIFAIKHFKETIIEVVSLFNTTVFSLLCNSIIVIIPMAQLIGHNKFLKNVLVHYQHIGSIKEVLEESVETYGYYLILCAAIELFCLCRKTLKEQN